MGPADGPEVVLFADTFNRYYESENLDAALAVLTRRGLSRAFAEAGEWGRAAALLRAHVPFSWSRERSARGTYAHGCRAPALREARRADRRSRAQLSSSPSATSCNRSCRARTPSCWRASVPVRGIRRQGNRRRPLQAGARRRSATKRCCTAIAIRKSFDVMGSVQKVLKAHTRPERRADRIDAAAAWRALRLSERDHRCVAQDGGTVAAPRRAQGGQPMPSSSPTAPRAAARSRTTPSVAPSTSP